MNKTEIIENTLQNMEMYVLQLENLNTRHCYSKRTRHNLTALQLRYTRHGQISLAIPPWVDAMSRQPAKRREQAHRAKY